MSINNLISLWKNASNKERIDGSIWYENAHRFADTLSFWSNKSIDVCAAVISALSPQLAWDKNINAAELLMQGNDDVWRSGALHYSIIKAKRILSGELKPIRAFSMSTGPKTFCFYRNILEPTKNTYVTIDRHAASAFLGYPFTKGLSPKRYWNIANEFLRAAKVVNVLPCVFQATLWLSIRNGPQGELFNA